MAQTVENIVQGSISSIKELKAEIAKLKDSMVGMTKGTEEWDKASEALYTAQSRLSDINKAAAGTLNTYTTSQKDSINTLKEKVKQLNNERNAMDMNSDEYAKATEELKVMNDKLRESATNAGDWKMNVGNYANSISSMFGETGVVVSGLMSQISSAGGGLKGMGAVIKSLLSSMNPWLLVLVAIVAIFKKFKDAIVNNEENLKRFKEIIAPLQAVMSLLNKAFEAVVGKMLEWVKALTQSETVVNGFKKVITALSTYFNIVKGVISNIITNISNLLKVFSPVVDKIREFGSVVTGVFDKAKAKIEGFTKAILSKMQPLIDVYNKVAGALGLTAIQTDNLKKAFEQGKESAENLTTAIKEESAEIIVDKDAKEEDKDATEKLTEAQKELNKTLRENTVNNAQLEVDKSNADYIYKEAMAAKDYGTALDALNERNAANIELKERALKAAQEQLRVANEAAEKDSSESNLNAQASAIAAVTKAQNDLNVAHREGEDALEAYNKTLTDNALKDYENAVKELKENLNLGNEEEPTFEAKGDYAGDDSDSEAIANYYNSLSEQYTTEYELYAAMMEQKIAKLQEFIELQKAAGNDTTELENETLALSQKVAKKKIELNEAVTQNQSDSINVQKKAEKQKANYILASTSDLMGNVSSLFEENTVAYKATATAKALIDTYLGVQDAIANTPGGAITKGIAAASVLAMGLANVMSIMKVDATGEDSANVSASSSAISAAQSTPAVVDTTPYSYTRSLQTEEEEETLNQPIYVSVTDINDVQNKVKVVENESSF